MRINDKGNLHEMVLDPAEIEKRSMEMIEAELRVKDIKEIIFPHPTVSEIVREVIWAFND